MYRYTFGKEFDSGVQFCEKVCKKNCIWFDVLREGLAL